jgi:hypothetical protein
MIAVKGKDGKFGYINSEGVEITPLKYDCAMPFRGNLGWVKLGRKWGFVDKQGKEIVPPVYNDIVNYFDWDYDPIVRIGKKYGYVCAETGEPLTPVKYDKVEVWTQIFDASSMEFGRAARVQLDGKWGCINAAGKEVIPAVYEEIKIFQFEYPHLAAKLNGKWDFFDENGKSITGFQYDDMECFLSGRARVKKDGKYGFINTEGAVVIPLLYDDCELGFTWHLSGSEQRNSPIWMKRGDKYGFVDISGNEIVEPQYEFAKPFSDNEDVSLAAVVRNGAVGFIDETGKMVIPCMYESDLKDHCGYHFSGGFANVKQGGKWGVIDTDNRVVLPFLYDRFIAIRYNTAFRLAIRKRRKVSVDRKGNERAVKKNPATLTFKDYLHAVEWAEVSESFKSLLNQNTEEDMKIWEINFCNFKNKQFKPSSDIIRIYSGRHLPIDANMFNPKSGSAFVFCDWAEILDMEVLIEDNLTLTNADIVAACIWEACDQAPGTEEKFNSYCKGLGEYAKILKENVKEVAKKLK